MTKRQTRKEGKKVRNGERRKQERISFHSQTRWWRVLWVGWVVVKKDLFT